MNTPHGGFLKRRRTHKNRVKSIARLFLEKKALEIVIDGKKIRGDRTPDSTSFWIRDYSDMLRGVKYLEPLLPNDRRNGNDLSLVFSRWKACECCNKHESRSIPRRCVGFECDALCFS